jgi:HSP20 family molecular chaperone IbpA
MKTIMIYDNPFYNWPNFMIDPFRDWDNLPVVFTCIQPVNSTVNETPFGYEICFSVSEMKKHYFKVLLDNNVLIVKGERKIITGKIWDSSRSIYESVFSANIELPENANTYRIKTKFSKGLLKVKIPKKKEYINQREFKTQDAGTIDIMAIKEKPYLRLFETTKNKIKTILCKVA